MKVFSIFAAMSLAVALAACGSSSDGGGGGNPLAANPGNNSGGGDLSNPVGKPGPAGAFSCYISSPAENNFTGCVDIPAAMIGPDKEQAKASCLQQANAGINVVWNEAGCSQEHHVGTCTDSVTRLKMRYYFVTVEKAREICQKTNPQNSFTTTY